MVAEKRYSTHEQFPALNTSYLHHMAEPLQLEQNCNVPFFFPSVGDANVRKPGYSTYNLFSPSTDRQNVARGPSELLPSHYNISPPTENPYLAESHLMFADGHGLRVQPIGVSSAHEKRFLIFDRSGDQMRLFFTPLSNPQIKTSSINAPVSTDFPFEEKADHQLLMKSMTGDEKWDENHLTDEGGDMGEDSEEINALLYSDSEDEYDRNKNSNYKSDEDEVTSTGHSPFINEECSNKDKSFQELEERDGGSSDVSVKRQRLLYGKYKVSSRSPMKHAVSGNDKDDVESGTSGYNNYSHDGISPSKREKQAKIRHALKVLESILPGLTSKDPLSVIDKAIVYLKSMGVGLKPTAFP